MASRPTLTELLTNSRPDVITGKALLALDLQDEFLSPSGKHPVSLLDGFANDFAILVPLFRQSGQVFWVRTEYEESKDVSGDSVVVLDQQAGADETDTEDQDSEDEFIRTVLNGKSSPLGGRPSAKRTADLLRRAAGRTSSRSHLSSFSVVPDELFLMEQSDPSRQCCMPQSPGAQLSPLATSLRDPTDLVALKRAYSAFNSTSLLTLLRLRMITNLYICGSLTNTSVYATATDAVGHGFKVTVIDDCLGYRNREAHEEALKMLVKVVGADLITASKLSMELGGSSISKTIPQQVPAGQDTNNTIPTFQMGNLNISDKNIAEDPIPTPSNSGPITNQGGVAEAFRSDTGSFNYLQPTRASQVESHVRAATFNDPSAISQASDSRRTQMSLIPRIIKKPGDEVGEGDSSVIYDILPQASSDLFSTLKNEVYWQKMLHASGEVPRLVCVQGAFGEDGSMPVYRHPSDHSLPLLHFSSSVESIMQKVENIVGHPINHVLIQLYRSGDDHISEHSDKTLDIVRGSSIVNVSLGAQRTMRLRTKKPPKSQQIDNEESTRRTQLVPLPHGSMFVLGPQTNKCWLHGINHDKRPLPQRSDAERAFGGERISLTFRHIGTYLDNNSQRIWGQGACAKNKADSMPVINGEPRMTQQLINAFGYENQQPSFDWDKIYGNGFDVLHFSEPPKELPLLFPSGNYVEGMRVKIFLEELGFTHRVAGVDRQDAGSQYKPEMCLRDVDAQKTQVYGDFAILRYLARIHGRGSTPDPLIAEPCSKLNEIHDVLNLSTPHTSLATLEDILEGRQYIAGDDFSIADCAYWPVVDEIIETLEDWNPENYPHVAAYHERMLARPSVRLATWSDACE